MKTSLSLTDEDKEIAEALRLRLGLDSVSSTVRFALRQAAQAWGVLGPYLVGPGGGAIGQATETPAPTENEAWGYGGTGLITDPFKIAAKNMGRPVAFVSFKKAVLDAYAPVDDPTERVYVEHSARLSKQRGTPVPPTVISWHLSAHKRWRRLVTLARGAIGTQGEAAFQAAAEAMYSGNPQPMLDLLYSAQ